MIRADRRMNIGPMEALIREYVLKATLLNVDHNVYSHGRALTMTSETMYFHMRTTTTYLRERGETPVIMELYTKEGHERVFNEFIKSL